MIELKGVTKRFAPGIEALAPLDLEIKDGERIGIIGRNGSGKTSLIRILVGLSQPSSGKIFIEGREPDREIWRRFHRSLGYMPERISMFENLTGEKTLRYFAKLKGAPADEVMPILERVGLADAARRRISGYSKGMLQRLNFAQALLGDPTVFVLDEPIEGLDAHGVQEFFELLRLAENRTVIFSSHRLPFISRVVDRICILSDGHVRALGSEDELYRDLDLPARIILRASPNLNGQLTRVLDSQPEAEVVTRNGRIVVSVSQREKMAFLSKLRELDPSLLDVRIEEPSLEEVLLETC